MILFWTTYQSAFQRRNQIIDGIGIVAVLTGFVDLQLHAEVARTFAAEERIRFVVVIVDAAVIVTLVAGEAVGLITVAAGVERIVLTDQGTAVGAGSVMVVIAVSAEGRVVCTKIVVPPNAITAPGTGDGELVQTLRTEQFVVEWGEG